MAMYHVNITCYLMLFVMLIVLFVMPMSCQYSNIGMQPLQNTIEHTRVKMLVSALEHQVP